MAKRTPPSYPSRDQLSARSATAEVEGKSDDFAATTLDRPVVELEDVLALAAREEQRRKTTPSAPGMPAQPPVTQPQTEPPRPAIAWRIVVVAIAICALAGAVVGGLAAFLS